MSNIQSPNSATSGQTSLETLSPDQFNLQPINLFDLDEITQTNLAEDFEDEMEWLELNQEQQIYETNLWDYFHNLPLDEQNELFLYND